MISITHKTKEERRRRRKRRDRELLWLSFARYSISELGFLWFGVMTTKEQVILETMATLPVGYITRCLSISTASSSGEDSNKPLRKREEKTTGYRESNNEETFPPSPASSLATCCWWLIDGAYVARARAQTHTHTHAQFTVNHIHAYIITKSTNIRLLSGMQLLDCDSISR